MLQSVIATMKVTRLNFKTFGRGKILKCSLNLANSNFFQLFLTSQCLGTLTTAAGNGQVKHAIIYVDIYKNVGLTRQHISVYKIPKYKTISKFDSIKGTIQTWSKVQRIQPMEWQIQLCIVESHLWIGSYLLLRYGQIWFNSTNDSPLRSNFLSGNGSS